MREAPRELKLYPREWEDPEDSYLKHSNFHCRLRLQ